MTDPSETEDGAAASFDEATIDAPPDDLASSETLPAVPGTGTQMRMQKERLRAQLFGNGDGQTLGHYQIQGELGRGGMGVVFEAYDPKLERKVAIKTLHAQGDDVLGERLVREAKAMAKLIHPNVVVVHEIGEVGGVNFIVMEFVEGITLRAWLDEKVRTLDELLPVFRDAARGLAAIHDRGLVHRDFKPDNVMVDASGRVVVMDLGIAHGEATPPDAPEMAGVPLDEAVAALTRTGALLGSPAYMAPEQFAAAAVTPRTDQFSFCVSLWEAVEGHRPHDAKTIHALMRAVLEGDRRPLDPQKTPAWLGAVLERGLAVEPDDRYPAMGAVVEALTPPDTTKPATRWAPIAAVTGVLAVAAVAGPLLLREDPPPPPPKPAPKVVRDEPLTPPGPRGPLEVDETSVTQSQVVLEKWASSVAVSEDGTKGAFVSGGGLWWVDLPSGAPTRVSEGVPKEAPVHFAKDGSVLFVKEGDGGRRLHRMTGPDAVSEVVGPNASSFCLLPEANALVAVVEAQKKLVRVSMGDPVGAPPVEIPFDNAYQFVTGVACDEARGRLIVSGSTDVHNGLATLPLEGGKATEVYSAEVSLSTPRLTAGGQQLWFLADREEATRVEVLPLDRAGAPAAAVLEAQGLKTFAVSAEGRLVQSRLSPRFILRKFEGTAKKTNVVGTVASAPGDYFMYRYHPDESSVAMLARDYKGRSTLSIRDLKDGHDRVVVEGLKMGSPTWSPDGRKLAYTIEIDGTSRVAVVDAGGGKPTVFEETNPAEFVPMGWRPNGELLYQTTDARNYALLSVDSGKIRLLFEKGQVDADGRPIARLGVSLSPDANRTLTWAMNPANPTALVMSTLELDDGKERKLTAWGAPMGWSRDGKYIYLWQGANRNDIFRVKAKGGKVRRWRTLPPLDLGIEACSVLKDESLACASKSHRAELQVSDGVVLRSPVGGPVEPN